MTMSDEDATRRGGKWLLDTKAGTTTIGHDMISVEWVGGEKKLMPVKYWIGKNASGPWWWRKTDYVVHSEFATLRGFKTMDEAINAVDALNYGT
jgi:hypothetical protein